MLRTAFGPAIAALLADPNVVEILVNPDGSLWFDTLGSLGCVNSHLVVAPSDAERIIRLVAAEAQVDVHAGAPLLATELPVTGERFQGVMPPVVRAPSFAIRKRASAVISLDAYVCGGVLSPGHGRFLRTALRNLDNILIAGPTSSGKTTLANALLAEIAHEEAERVVVLEDTVELQCASADHIALRTTGQVSMAELVRATLRLRPDRIIVGEVRGGEALDLLKAWGTGHPGGIATIHANSPQAAMNRLEQLILECATTVPRALIADTVNVIVVITGRGRQRKVERIVQMRGLNEHGYIFDEVKDLEGEIE
jgi:type IV secretion system protein VirB11